MLPQPRLPATPLRICWIGPPCPHVDGPLLALAGLIVISFRDLSGLEFAAANRRGVIVIAPDQRGVVAVLGELGPLARRGAHIIALVERASDRIEAIRVGAADALPNTVSAPELRWRIGRWSEVHARDLERRRVLAALRDDNSTAQRELLRLEEEIRELRDGSLSARSRHVG